MGHKYVAAGGFAEEGEAHGQEFFFCFITKLSTTSTPVRTWTI